MRVNGDRRPSAPWCRSAAGLGRFSSAVMAPVKGISCARLRSRAAITSCITTSTSSTPRWRPAHRDHHQRRLHVQALPQGRTSARSSGIAVFDNRSSVRPAPHLSPIWRFSIFIGAGSTKPRRLRLIFSVSRASSTIPRSHCRPIIAPGQWAVSSARWLPCWLRGLLPSPGTRARLWVPHPPGGGTRILPRLRHRHLPPAAKEGFAGLAGGASGIRTLGLSASGEASEVLPVKHRPR